MYSDRSQPTEDEHFLTTATTNNFGGVNAIRKDIHRIWYTYASGNPQNPPSAEKEHYGIENVEIGIDKFLKNKKVILIKEAKNIEDNKEQQRSLKLYHQDKIFGGQCGAKKLYAHLRANYFWKKMSFDAHEYVRKCEKCMLNNAKLSS